MGYPMAGHLARAGHEVVVYNRTAARARAWVGEYGGRACDTPATAAAGAAFVFACTGNDDDLRHITAGEGGAFAGMQRGAVFVDHTTVSPTLTRELAAEAEGRGLGYLLDCYAKKTLLMGPVGSGQLTKLVNQICIAGLVQALAEGLHFAQRAGLDARRAVEVISQGAAQSWQMDNRAGTMLEGKFDFGFAVDWMRKDLGIALAEARRQGATLPVTDLVDRFYAELQAAGGGRFDTSSLITRLG
jgi:3-hydroxyisobutyrate dehydrogenase